MKPRYSGSITVFLSLILTLMVSLVCAGLESVRTAAARVQILSAVDIGLYSLFAQYDRELLKKYDIFALDASGADGLPDLSSVYDSFAAYMDPILLQNSQRLSVLQGGLGGYSLLTDDNGEVFFRQVVEYMQETILAQGITMLQSHLEQKQFDAAQAEEAGRSAEHNNTMTQYQNEVNSAAEKSNQERIRREQEAAAAAGGSSGSDLGGLFSDADPGGLFVQEDTVPAETVENPIPFIQQVRQRGLLGLVLPADHALSELSLEDEYFVSKRNRQTGFSMENWCLRETSFMGDALFLQYLASHLGHYRKPSATGLNYQQEYIVGQTRSDKDNLEKVATRLLLIREGLNIACITQDPVMMGEVSALASGIAAAFLVPPAVPAIEGALIVCWAFGESILDLRELFAGGKVPAVKTAANWQLSLANLTGLLQRLDSDRRSDPGGLSYEDYLQILMLPKSRAKKAMGAMDMIEQSLRKMDGWENFHLDACVTAVTVYAVVSVNRGRVLTVERSFGYT